MVIDYQAVVATLGGVPAWPARLMQGTGGYRVQHTVKIGGRLVNVDVRWSGDNYLDPAWLESVVRHRQLSPSKDFYVMAPADYLFTLTYHAVVQKPIIAADYAIRLASMGSRLAESGRAIPLAPNLEDHNLTAALLRGTATNARRADRLQLLRRHMEFNGYRFTDVRCEHTCPRRADINFISQV